MSNGFFPGLNELLNGSALQATCLLVKPSCFATAYATADSYPFPLYGFEIFHGFFSGPPQYGGNAGCPLPMRERPVLDEGEAALRAAWNRGWGRGAAGRGRRQPESENDENETQASHVA